ncbi:hypothetical protein FM107_17760 [Sphingobacterium sp. JB170]|nr:hypothetical protein FM107_17760 [Sphingobacterium sp. JB170]
MGVWSGENKLNKPDVKNFDRLGSNARCVVVPQSYNTIKKDFL